jgi:RNA polymerase sigma-70 factor (ECF subfamily)
VVDLLFHDTRSRTAMTTAYFDSDTDTIPLPIPAPPDTVETIDLAPYTPALAALKTDELVDLAQAGNSAAFGQIYDRYLNAVYRYVLFRVHSNKAIAEDITSDVFVQALRKINGYRNQGQDFGAWLMTVARNKVYDHYRSSRNRRELLASDVISGTSQRIDLDHPIDTTRTGDPEATTIDQAVNDALMDAIRQLRPEQQEALVLRFFLGYSVAETAEVMGKREGAIKALVYRAVKRLKSLLGGDVT